MFLRRALRAFNRADPITIALVVLLLAAFALRVYKLDWDDGHYLHPDERHIAIVITSRISLDWPPDFDNLLDPAVSRLNPRSNDPETGTPRDFAYGALPLIVTEAVAAGLTKITGTDWSTYDSHIYKVGRALSSLFDTLTVVVVFSIGRRVFNRRVGLIAATVAALAPMSIQLAHFFTTDSWLTFFVSLTLLLALKAAESGQLRWFAAAGAAFGLAMATKGSVFTLAGLLVVAVAYDAYRRWRGGQRLGDALLREPINLLIAGAAAVATFAVFEPYAIARPLVYLDQIRWQSDIVRGVADMPFTRQYVGTTPVVYQVEQLVKWGFGPVAGLLAFAGVLILLRRFLRDQSPGQSLLLAWFAGYGLVIALPETKFLRYLAPLTPVLALTAGLAFDSIWSWISRHGRQRLAAGMGLALLVGLGLWTASFTSIYAVDNPRIAASKWLYANIPPGSTVSAEYWDDALPMDLAPGLTRTDFQITTVSFDLYAHRPSDEAANHIFENLVRADYVILSSNRVSSAMPRSPWRYPVQERYYELLRSGRLGFELVGDFHRYPGIGPVRFPDQSADESFINYDHPQVLIYQKQSLTSRATFDQLMAWAVAQPVSPTRHPPRKSLLLDDPVGDLPVVADARWSAALTANSAVAFLVWVALLAALQAAGHPLASVLFGRFADAGWGFSRLMTLLVAGYVVWLGASIRLISFRAVWAAIAVLFVAATWILWQRRRQSTHGAISKSQRRAAWWCEGVFWSVFSLFLTFRYLNPDSWHPFFGGEKPMEFAHINAMLRSAHVPPYDPWYADGYINYYYYGLYLVAFCMKLTGIPSEIAFNLAQPTVMALLATGAFSVAATIGRDAARRQRIAVPAGLLGVFLTVLAGNLDSAARLVDSLPGPISPTFDWTWGASRAILGAITEFPYFTGLYADLHAHVVALPLTVLAIGLAYSIAREPRLAQLAVHSRRPTDFRLLIALRSFALALTLGTLSATNAWDVPIYLALAGIALFMATAGMTSLPARIGVALFGAAGIGGVAYALFLPFFQHYVALFGSLERVRTKTSFWEFSSHLGGLLAIIGIGLVVSLLGHARGVWPVLSWPIGPIGMLAVLLVGRLVILDADDSLASTLTSGFVLAMSLLLAAAAWNASGAIRSAERRSLVRVVSSAASIVALVTLWTERPVLAIALGFAGAAAALWLSADRVGAAFLGAMVASASLIVAGVELVFLVDDLAGDPVWYRMNTVFKFYNQVWIIFALSAAGLAAIMLDRAWSRLVRPFDQQSVVSGTQVGVVSGVTEPETGTATRQDTASRGASTDEWAIGGVLITVLVVAALLCYPLLATKPRLEQRFIADLGSGTLNALDWMDYATVPTVDGPPITFHGDRAAINWFNMEVNGSPVIAEASFGPYRCNGSRISIATGLPTIMGWQRHEHQQRYPDDLGRREEDVRRLYTTASIAEKLAILRQYKVEYVVVGDLERLYPTVRGNDCVPGSSAAGIAAFESMVGTSLTVTFESNGTKIYRVNPPGESAPES